jgi:hypothetical protein
MSAMLEHKEPVRPDDQLLFSTQTTCNLLSEWQRLQRPLNTNVDTKDGIGMRLPTVCWLSQKILGCCSGSNCICSNSLYRPIVFLAVYHSDKSSASVVDVVTVFCLDDCNITGLPEQIQMVWANNVSSVVSMLSFDISGAFDNVSHELMSHNIRDARLPQWVAEYIRSFLTNRTTTLMLGTYEDRVRPTTSGIPQGSTLSPILFLFFASTLLPQLNAGAMTSIGFVDDTNIITFSRSTEANCRVLERANEKHVTWARTHGATFAPEKYQLMHFTRRPRKFNMQATVRISKFQDGPVPVIRILGIHLDSKLKWGSHVNLTAAKAASHMASITLLTKSTWGATFVKARQIYAAVVRPVLAYGCPVWFSRGDERANRNRLIYPLQTVQNKCLRTITGAYKTTNVQVLEHGASVPPLDLHLEMLATNHVRRIEDSAGDEVVEETRKAVAQRAQRCFRTEGNVPTRHIDQFRTRAESMQQQSHLAGPDRGRSKTAAKRELEETWKARWTKYQQQTCTVANDNKLLDYSIFSVKTIT